jgi:hypothetical protein
MLRAMLETVVFEAFILVPNKRRLRSKRKTDRKAVLQTVTELPKMVPNKRRPRSKRKTDSLLVPFFLVLLGEHCPWLHRSGRKEPVGS